MIQTDNLQVRPAEASGSILWRIGRSKYTLLLLGLTVLLAVGLAVFRDFGASVDEWINNYHGELFLRVYETGSLLRSPRIDYFHGPFYFMVFTVLSKFFRMLNPDLLPTDGIHLTNLLTFLVGLFFLFRLCLRGLPRGVSLFVTALFALQPVLFGHAFINQKDVPLMVFFLASVELGWTAVDRLSAGRGRPGPRDGVADDPPRRSPAVEWRSAPRAQRWMIILAAVIILLLLMDVWLFHMGEGSLRGLLVDAYQGQGPRLIAATFARIAQDAYKTPLEAYLSKLDRFVSWGRVPLTAALLAGGVALGRRAFPRTYARTVGARLRTWGPLFVAGAVLGLTNSIRILAPFAGFLVGVQETEEPDVTVTATNLNVSAADRELFRKRIRRDFTTIPYMLHIAVGYNF